LIKETITFKDFTGEEHTEDFHFHLTEADVMELELSAEGNSLSAWMQKIVKSEKGAAIIATFKKIIDVSYGVKSDDGRRFTKSPEILEEFKSSNAYSKLFMKLATDANAASVFVNGIMPEEMRSAAGQKNQKPQVAGLTPSEQARKASEQQMQGFRKPQPQEKAPVLEPDLPVSQPVQSEAQSIEQPLNADQLPPVTPEVPSNQQDINNMSIDQLRALALNQQGQGNIQ
jgi:hypothetical protein